MGWVIDCCFGGGGIVVKFMGGDASVVVVKKLEDGRDKWCNLSSDGVVKGGQMFDVYGFDDLLYEGPFEK